MDCCWHSQGGQIQPNYFPLSQSLNIIPDMLRIFTKVEKRCLRMNNCVLCKFKIMYISLFQGHEFQLFCLFFAKPNCSGYVCTQMFSRQIKRGDFEVGWLAMGHRQFPHAKIGQTAHSVRRGRGCYRCPFYICKVHTVLASVKVAISAKPIKMRMWSFSTYFCCTKQEDCAGTLLGTEQQW